MNPKRPLYGPSDPRGPSVGRDVWVFQRAAAKVPGIKLDRTPTETFDGIFQNVIVTLQKRWDIKPASGAIGYGTANRLWPFVDAYGRWVYWRWDAPPPEPKPPPTLPLIEPHQGFESLVEFLWDEYSTGIRMGLKDGPGTASGTYNKDSRLPSGAKSDHAFWPSFAFDLDIVRYTGWSNDNARAFFYYCVGRPRLNYVILGNKIWSKAREGEGVRPYYGGGHDNHVHVSGTH